MPEPLLELNEVTVRFGSFVAVDRLSLCLHGGELVGLIGPNGAGKTTTLRAAAGLQAVHSGRVRVFGHDVAAEPARVGTHLGFTPDTPAVYDTLTVEQYLAFVGDCYGLGQVTRDERIGFWLEQLWLTDKRKAKIKTLSRGMRQRLAVARTLLSNPHVVLLDEPAAGLDPAGRIQFRRMLASLRDQGRAVVVSSHILADLAEYCTHIGIMEHGRMLRYDTVHGLAGAPQTRCRYRVVLAQTTGDAAHRIDGLAGLSQLEIAGDQLTFEFDRDRASAAQLLQRLIAAGLPVAEFGPLNVNLEEAYLRSGIRQVD